MIYKLLSMRNISLDEPYFEIERFNNFLEIENQLGTHIGEKIFHNLIVDHPRYSRFLRPMESQNLQDSITMKLEAITFDPKTIEFVGKGYGKEYSDISDSAYEIIHQNPCSMTMQKIDGQPILLINLCTNTTKRNTMKLVKKAIVLLLSVTSKFPVIKLEIEDAYSIKSSLDDCYELDNLDVTLGGNDLKAFTLPMPIAYAYTLDGDAPSLNCERMRDLSRDLKTQDSPLNILVEPNRASDVISFSSTAYLFAVTVKTDKGEQNIKYTFALAKDEDGCLVTNEQGYFYDASQFELLASEQRRICGKEVSWKAKEDNAKRSIKS